MYPGLITESAKKPMGKLCAFIKGTLTEVHYIVPGVGIAPNYSMYFLRPQLALASWRHTWLSQHAESCRLLLLFLILTHNPVQQSLAVSIDSFNILIDHLTSLNSGPIGRRSVSARR